MQEFKNIREANMEATPEVVAKEFPGGVTRVVAASVAYFADMADDGGAHSAI
jgi:hypothetical protein